MKTLKMTYIQLPLWHLSKMDTSITKTAYTYSWSWPFFSHFVTTLWGRHVSQPLRRTNTAVSLFFSQFTWLSKMNTSVSPRRLTCNSHFISCFLNCIVLFFTDHFTVYSELIPSSKGHYCPPKKSLHQGQSATSSDFMMNVSLLKKTTTFWDTPKIVGSVLLRKGWLERFFSGHHMGIHVRSEVEKN